MNDNKVTLDSITPEMTAEERQAARAEIGRVLGVEQPDQPLLLPGGEPCPDQATADTLATNLLKLPVAKLSDAERGFLRRYVAQAWKG